MPTVTLARLSHASSRARSLVLRRAIAGALLTIALPGIAQAQLTATTRASLTDGTFFWSTINAGPGGTFIGTLGSPTSFTGTVAGINFTVSRADRMQLQTTTAPDGFPVGERILGTANQASQPITILFGTAISGFGLNMQSINQNAFTARVEYFNGATSLGFLEGTGIGPGAVGVTSTAPFVGGTSTTAFDRVVLSVPVNGSTGFFVDQFSIRTVTQTVTPEPGTYALMASGLVALGVAARRRRTT